MRGSHGGGRGDIRELINEQLTINISSLLEISSGKLLKGLDVKCGFEEFGQCGKLISAYLCKMRKMSEVP